MAIVRNIDDIAKLAGVSRSTVSRVLNGEPYVKEATREKVLTVIETMGYRPNPAARSLVTQRTQAIGVVIPHDLATIFDNPWYFPTLLQGISDRTTERGYAVLLWMGETETQEDLLFQRVTQNRLMDGMLVASATSDNPLIPHLFESQTIFVTVERPAIWPERGNFVCLDNIQGAQAAVSHLVRLGRRRIGTVTGMLTNMDGVDRLEGYKLGLRDNGLDYDPEWIYEGTWNTRTGYLGGLHLIRSGVDAIFAASDIMAAGVMQAADELGKRIPEDIALVGFDDLPIAATMRVPLTTVRQPLRRKGAVAADLLIDMIEERVSGPQQIVLSTQLIVRQSCGADIQA
jgi:LacI family transcriptional regulator